MSRRTTLPRLSQFSEVAKGRPTAWRGPALPRRRGLESEDERTQPADRAPHPGPVVRVFIDANALIRDPGLRAAYWPAVADAVRRRILSPAVPELAIAEAARHLTESLSRHANDLAKINRERASYGLESWRPPPHDSEEHEVTDRLRASLRSLGLEIVPTPDDIALAGVLERAIRKQPPFSQSGRGFKDTIIWLTILRQLGASDSWIVVTGDRDFLDSAAALNQEATSRGLSPCRFYASMEEMVGAIISPLPKLEEELTERLANDLSFREDVRNAMESAILLTYSPFEESRPGFVVSDVDVDGESIQVTAVVPTALEESFFVELGADCYVTTEYPEIGSTGEISREVTLYFGATYNRTDRSLQNGAWFAVTSPKAGGQSRPAPT